MSTSVRRSSRLATVAVIAAVAVLALFGQSASAAPANGVAAESGSNGSGTAGAASGVRPDSLPGGYCVTYYDAYTSHAAFTVNVQSIGECSGNIEDIFVAAYVTHGGSQVADNSFFGTDTSESDTTATYHCKSLSACNSGSYGGSDQQSFWNVSGWTKPIGSCKASDQVMTCVGTLKSFTF